MQHACVADSVGKLKIGIVNKLSQWILVNSYTIPQ